MRYALGVEYDGSAFYGWQQLGHGRLSVQETLQTALSQVANSPISVVCAGRTDAGVHAQCQVVHFDSDVPRTPRAWLLGTTSQLPPSVCVRWCVPVADDFNARFAAIARRYQYRILNRQIRPALYRDYVTWVRQPLDSKIMHSAAQYLLGENDFSAFRSSQCQARHARRNMQYIQVQQENDVITLDLQANAFLHHMVRNIVGSLLEVGWHQRPENWLGELLAGKDRNQAGPTASAQGLVFKGPLYDAKWELPDEVTFLDKKINLNS